MISDNLKNPSTAQELAEGSDGNHEETLIDQVKQGLETRLDTLKQALNGNDLLPPQTLKNVITNLTAKLGDKVVGLENVKNVALNALEGMQLEEIQAIVLRDRPTPYYGTVVAIKVHDASVGRTLLKNVIPFVSNSRDWKKQMSANLTVVMTYQGLKALGLPQTSLDSFPESFQQGMAARAKQLRDAGENAPEHWLSPFGTGDIHVCAAIIADSQENWQTKLTELKTLLAPSLNHDNPSQGAIEILIEKDFGADEAVKNVFGFRDGISNPKVAGSGSLSHNDPELPIASGEFVLGYKGESGVIPPMPQPEVLGRNGAYMVLRKYQSHVAAFNDYCLQHSETPEAAEKLAAKMFGRWRSGAPLSLTPEADDPELGADDSRNNQFDYSNDKIGKGCPLGSHARRMNPRKSTDFILADVRLHRIIRKSVTFGDIVPPHVTTDDGKERGQFFMGINAHAMDTLEFLQSQWINDGNFMSLGEERDPIVGVHQANRDNEADTFTVPSDPLRQRNTGILQFNTVQGGEYLFIPSLSALKWMSELSDIPT